MARGQSNPMSEFGKTFADAFVDAKSSWRMGETGRFLPRPKGIAAGGSNADYHWLNESRYYFAMERARYWEREEPVVRAGLDRVVSNVFGEEGPQLNPKTPDEAFNKDAQDRFAAWADDENACDHEGEDDFWQLSQDLYYATLRDGDQLALPLESGQIQIIEGHRIKRPTNTKLDCVLGVLLEGGRAKEYWVSRDDVGVTASISKVGDIVKIPARDEDGYRNAFFPRQRRRKSMTRGVTVMAPAADYIGMQGDIQFATMVKAQVAACFVLIDQLQATAPTAPKLGHGNDGAQVGERREELRGDGSRDIIENIGPATRVRSQPGSRLEGFSPNIPNPEFFPHAMMILTFIAITFGVPVSVLLMDPSNTNFSGWRGAIDEARKGWRAQQKWFTRHWFAPVYEWKLRQFAAEDAAFRRTMERLGKQAFAHDWQSPGWDYIEPMKDASSDLLQVRNGMISQRRRCAKRNIIWKSEAKDIVQDNAIIIRAALDEAQKINKEYGLTGSKEIDWREVAMLPTPDGVKVSLDEPAAAPAAAAGKTTEQPPAKQGTAA
jgi:capsid protein